MSRQPVRLAAALLATTLSVAVLAAEAHATEVEGDLSRFVVKDGILAGQPPVNGPDAFFVDVATVDGQSIWKLTTDTPVRSVGGTCTRISGTSGVSGPSEIHCRRGTEIGESLADLGDGGGRFIAAPGFPDRLRLLGGKQDDEFVGGTADDVIVGGDGNNVLNGMEGDDALSMGIPERSQFADIPGGDNQLRGGSGRDRLFGADGDDFLEGGEGDDLLGGGRGTDELFGNEGNDLLNGTEDAFVKRDRLTGGPDTDRFFGDVTDQIFARDGIAEQVSCAPVRFANDPLALAEVDLKDIVEFGKPCPIVLRAPRNEAPSSRVASATTKLRGRVVRVTVRCATVKRCRGRVAFRLVRSGSRQVTARYRLAGRTSRSMSLRLGAADAARVTRRATKATAQLTERGIAGDRTVVRAVTVSR